MIERENSDTMGIGRTTGYQLSSRNGRNRKTVSTSPPPVKEDPGSDRSERLSQLPPSFGRSQSTPRHSSTTAHLAEFFQRNIRRIILIRETYQLSQPHGRHPRVTHTYTRTINSLICNHHHSFGIARIATLRIILAVTSISLNDRSLGTG